MVLRSRPYVDAVVFMGAAWADVRAYVDQEVDQVGQVAWAEAGGLVHGGRAAVAAAAARALGRQFVDLVAIVGDDAIGGVIKDAFHNAGVATRLVETVASGATGIRQLVIDPAGNRRAIGIVNARKGFDDSHMIRVESTIVGAEMLFVTLETPWETLVKSTSVAVKHGIPIVLNATPLPSPDGVTRIDRRLLSMVDVVLVDWESAMALTGLVDLNGRSGAELCERVLASGAKRVVMTLGRHGAIVANEQSLGLVDPIVSQPTDVTWADNVFAGALAVGLTNQSKGRWRWEELVAATEFATAASGLCGEHMTSLTDLPTKAAIEKLMSPTSR